MVFTVVRFFFSSLIANMATVLINFLLKFALVGSFQHFAIKFLSQKRFLARLKSASKSLLSRIYTGDFFAYDFLIKMDVAKLHIFNNGSHFDESYFTAENDCLKLFPFR